MTDEMGLAGKEVVVAKLRHYSQILLKGLRKTMRNIQGDQCPGQDSNRAHPSTSLVVLHSYTTALC